MVGCQEGEMGGKEEAKLGVNGISSNRAAARG